MSERPTPETDANTYPAERWTNVDEWEHVKSVDAEFARRLERERDEARGALREIAGMDTSQLASPQQCGAVALAADFLGKLEAAK